jgi:hypothetical protein
MDPKMSKPALIMRRWTRRAFVPAMADVFFVALLVAGFARAGGWQQLLADGDTGWHVRTGELVLASGRAPVADPFSFSRANAAWYAWEWLSDALFAIAFRHGGLGGVALLSGLTLCLAGAVLFLWLLRRRSGLWIAAAVTLATVSASSVHYLARPHVFSILLFTVSLWVLDEARGERTALLWLLPPLCGLWANLHAGFMALPVSLAAASLIEALGRRRREAVRYLAVGGLCLAASLANPYGWNLHKHIAGYLRSSWIMDYVQEFQSPSIRSEETIVFAALLLGGAALASRTMARGRYVEAGLTLLWGFAALRSARHIPLFAVAAAPVISGELAYWWEQAAERSPSRSPVRLLWKMGQELGRPRGLTAWAALLSAAAVMASPPGALGFSDRQFPVQMVEREIALLAPSNDMPRILTSDQWGDYLIYRLYPRQRVFFDGRSDFYGERLGADYRLLQSGGEGWRDVLERQRFDLALLPRTWPLNGELDREPGWRRVGQDAVAVLYGRTQDRRATP